MNFPDINPVIISFGPLAVSWYSLAYLLGVLLGWWYANRIIDKFKIGISRGKISDFITWCILGIIIGGRLGFVLFYNPSKYLASPFEIIKTYEGGMSFHGGIVGVIIASYLFCKKYKISFFALSDIIAVVAPIGIGLGRVANFINAELYGRVTVSPIGVIFPGSDLQPRHPSQLYEAFLEGFLLLLVMSYITWRRGSILTPKLNSAIFLLVYTIFRFISELFREPDENLGFFYYQFTMGQILSIPMFITGLYLLYAISRDKN